MDTLDMSRRLALASNLKELRRRKGWNQEQLAEASNLSLGAIKQIETCKRWPKSSTLEILAKALGISSSVLLGAQSALTPSVESLLNAIATFQKENEQLRDLLSKIPPEWLARLAVKSKEDFAAIAARAFLTLDLSELQALKLPDESMAAMRKLMAKNAR
jgi:transcriptional regulator with XRE-family HTH domain